MEEVLTCICKGQSWSILGLHIRCNKCGSVANLLSLYLKDHPPYVEVERMNHLLRTDDEVWEEKREVEEDGND